MIDPNPTDISMVVPVHNSPGDLDECLLELKAASTAQSEIIVVDDASTQNIALVAASETYVFSSSRKPPDPERHGFSEHVTPADDVLFFVDAML